MSHEHRRQSTSTAATATQQAPEAEWSSPGLFAMPPGYWAHYGIQMKLDPSLGLFSLGLVPAAYWEHYGMGTGGGEGAREAGPSVQRRGEGGQPEDPARVHEAAQRGLSGPAQALPYLDQIQRSFGHHDVSGVRAHLGGPAAEASRSMGAVAYAAGDSVAFREAPDLHTAAHEAAHVVQQRGGVQLKGGVGEEGDAYERSADAVADRVAAGQSAQHLLDGFASAERAHGSTVQHQIQRLSQPIQTAAPATAITIRQFIQLVEAEEAKWPPAEQTQTGLMITRLRKIFYGTGGWDSKLIPGAAGVSSGYNVSEVEDSQENVPLTGPDATFTRTHQQTIDPATGRPPAIAGQQEVRLEDGSFCDIGHVFTGLDAANHPTSIAAPFGLATATDSKAAVTWTGDLGSNVAEWLLKAMQTDVPTAVADMQRVVNEFSPGQDMLGDIDAYIIADTQNITDSAGKKVSELLRTYYLSAPTTSDGRAREHRYSRFCSLTGLTGWSGGAFGNESAWLDRWTPEVAGCAGLYFGAGVKANSSYVAYPGIAGTVSALADPANPLARMACQLFLDSLKARVAAEPP